MRNFKELNFFLQTLVNDLSSESVDKGASCIGASTIPLAVRADVDLDGFGGGGGLLGRRSDLGEGGEDD
jgi:hypothetical protein